MALFEARGWTVSEKPIPGPSRTSNNKRKHRLAGSDVAVEKLNNASVNVEKLMAKLGGSISEENTRKKRKRSKIAVEKPATTRVLVPNDVGARLDTTGEDPVEGIKCSDGDTGVSRKKSKAKAKATAKIEGKQPTHGSRPHSKELSEQSSGLTALQSDMKHSLDGARFR